MVAVQAPTRKPLGWQHGWAGERQAPEMKMLLLPQALDGDTSVSDIPSCRVAAVSILYLMSTVMAGNGQPLMVGFLSVLEKLSTTVGGSSWT